MTKCDHETFKPGLEMQFREGSKVRSLELQGRLVGMIEANPDHPVRLHRPCGCVEDIRPDGMIEVTLEPRRRWWVGGQ